jgi:hypothetical protein
LAQPSRSAPRHSPNGEAGLPSAFFVTPHYRGYDWMLIRLASVKPEELQEQLVAAWKRRASKKLLAAFDSR